MARDPIAGPDSGPEPPFPIQLNGRIVKGFGRGSKELGIPTANLPLSGLSIGGHENIPSGVYYGWAAINLRGSVGDASNAASAPAPAQDKNVQDATREATEKYSTNSIQATTSIGQGSGAEANGVKEKYDIYPTVLSIGYNPFYGNSVRSVEVHVMHKFDADFYNAMMNLSILGFIREERNYDSMEALVEDIHEDAEVARRSLEREAYVRRRGDGWLGEWGWG